ncbi:MAG: hypothetical protein ACT6FF_02550 [Methanosarcinaceae archaeon]
MSIKDNDMRLNRELEDASWEDFDASNEVNVVPELKWGEHATLLKLDSEMLEHIRLIGAKKGKIGTHTLLKLWIAERVIDELAHLKKTVAIS